MIIIHHTKIFRISIIFQLGNYKSFFLFTIFYLYTTHKRPVASTYFNLFLIFSSIGFIHFPMLCTMQYNSHWVFTFISLLNVNLLIFLQYVMSANTGSIICCRLEYISRYAGSSIFFFIFSDKFSSYFLSAMYNVLACFFDLRALRCFNAIHFSINGHLAQSHDNA